LTQFAPTVTLGKSAVPFSGRRASHHFEWVAVPIFLADSQSLTITLAAAKTAGTLSSNWILAVFDGATIDFRWPIQLLLAEYYIAPIRFSVEQQWQPQEKFLVSLLSLLT